MYPPATVDELRSAADVVVDLLPHTLATGGLWDAPRLLITPHVVWSGPDLGERRCGVIRQNSRRSVRGEPLLGEFDQRDQY